MSNGKSPKKIINLNKYDDPTALSPKNLEIGLWLVNNRKRIYKIIIIFLITLCAGFLLYSGYGYAYYFIFGRDQDKALEENSAGVDINAYRQQNIPIDLTYGQAKVISSNTGSDFIVTLKNSNEKQSANFNFCFIKGDEKVCGSNFILPNEEKNIIVIGSAIKTASGVASFEIHDITWQKLKAGEIPDWNIFKTQHLNFAISEPKFLTYGGGVSYLEFDITNNSSYGYFEIPLNITINQGNEIVAINRYILKELNSRETKSIRLSWSEAANLGGTVSITPELNILNNSIYKPYTSN